MDPGRDLRRGGFLELSLVTSQKLEDPTVARTGSLRDYEWPAPPPGTDPIGSLREPRRPTVKAETDMVVLGSRGVGGFTRLMLASTAGQVVQHAHCPVLIVPPEDRD